jgi:FKBP-type peptidyl-prolyl cis-trans isomerase
MNLKLIKSLVLVGLVALFISSCDNTHPGFKKSESGIYYQIISNVDSTSNIKIDSGKFWNLTMSYGTPDTLLFDAAQSNNQAFDIPFAEPTYPGDINEALALLAKGDSAVFIIKADSFFLKTARSPEVPELFKENNDLYFWVKVNNIYTAEELEANKQAMLEERKALELKELTEYLSGNYPDLEPTSSGLFIIKEIVGSGNMPNDGDIMNFDFKVSALNGPELYNSIDAGRAVDHEKGKRFDTEGFSEGLNSMRVGDEVTLIVPSKLAFKDQGRPGMIEPYTTMRYWIRMNSVKTKAQHEKELAEQKAKEEAKTEKFKNEEAVTINNYIQQNNVTVAPTASGLYYIETAEGTGVQAAAGDKVKVHYNGTLLDGTKFDSSYDRDSPFEFTLGKNQVIKGWDEGIALMKEGGKATFIIPSSIGYGPRGRGNIIHQYAPLKFDVELIQVTKAEEN